MKTYFITGTDTDVGKTVATCQLLRGFAAQGLRAVAMKPVASGCTVLDGELVNADVEAHRAAGNVVVPAELANPYRFAPPISPHLAAREAGVAVSLDHLAACAAQLQAMCDVLLIEGAGGWHAPLTMDADMQVLAQRFGAPVILVVGMRLGCLNHALLSANAIVAAGLPLAGWIANRIDPGMDRYDDNLAWLRQHLPAPLLGEIAHAADAVDGCLNTPAVAQLAT
ncbi:dethiobiotin synthase [Jeongeupia sp. USM3]|uniref:dethiobiotin synthase n=1 Tax=Jeongeupia sp. USM3 TaxID=1906741 RepID=UPI00089DE3E6|nr:dethiobiotin synthase [Jeongeupia sp. USM3]AOY02010.1 dethiobiotin synthase [Jeongeupia sp. USM3]